MTLGGSSAVASSLALGAIFIGTRQQRGSRRPSISNQRLMRSTINRLSNGPRGIKRRSMSGSLSSARISEGSLTSTTSKTHGTRCASPRLSSPTLPGKNYCARWRVSARVTERAAAAPRACRCFRPSLCRPACRPQACSRSSESIALDLRPAITMKMRNAVSNGKSRWPCFGERPGE